MSSCRRLFKGGLFMEAIKKATDFNGDYVTET